MKRHRQSVIIGIGLGLFGFVVGCSHREAPTAVETRTTEEEEDGVTGILFEMESDSLEEDIYSGGLVWDSGMG